jgi:hypothetical protein
MTNAAPGSTATSPLRDRRVLTTAVLLIAIFLAASGLLDESAADHTDGVFQTALLTLAAARGLDAAISLAQGTEIALQPAGVGLTLSAGELLDPVNDLVEQFSSLMLIAATSLGLQGLLVRASGWWVFSALLMAALAVRVAMLWAPTWIPPRWGALLRRAIVVLLMVRFAVPLFALGTGILFENFLEPSRADAVRLLEETTGDVREMERLQEDSAAAADAGWLDRVSGWFAETVETLDVEERIEAFRQRVGSVAEQVLHLLVVFSLQTIVLPLAFLWVIPRLAGAALDRLR